MVRPRPVVGAQVTLRQQWIHGLASAVLAKRYMVNMTENESLEGLTPVRIGILGQ